MRLRIDDFKRIPLFNFVNHKLKGYSSESVLLKRKKELGDLIRNDMENIDEFVKKWHQLHEPKITDTEGNTIDS